MKKTPLRRSPMNMERKPIRRVNPERARRLRQLQFGKAAEAVRAMPCCVCFMRGPSQPHHVKSRGSGGTSADLVPLCWWCHNAVHCMGTNTFNEHYQVNLKDIAERIASELAGA